MKKKLFLTTLLMILSLSLIGCAAIEEQLNKSKEKNEDTKKELTYEDIMPPGLTVIIDGKEHTPTKGSYSWSEEHSDGKTTSIEADTDTPSNIAKDLDMIKVEKNTKIELEFEKKPTSYGINIWDENNNVIETPKEFDLTEKEGKVIYEVHATWKNGDARFMFVLNVK